jgi:uncharacterized protein
MTRIICAVSFLLILGCASYQSKVLQARNTLAEGRPQAAADLLKEMAKEPGKDQVLYMLDYGLALHEARNFKDSNETLIAVDRLAEVKDYISLGRQAGSLFLSESLVQYKSERFENILINAYLALNFTLENNFESALVECRRIDEKLRAMKLDNESLRKSYYARYLSAMIWEAERNWDSAYIDYLNAYQIDGARSYLGKDLIRSAWRARRREDLTKWQKQFPQYKLAEIQKETREQGELVFIYQQGWIPRKAPRPENFRFPHLVPVHSGFTQAVVQVNGQRYPGTELLYDVGQEAIRTLDADFNYLVAKKIIGIVAKEVLADQIRQKDELLGAIAAIAMHASDQADLRQWSTLPNTLQISKISLPPGEQDVVIYARGPAGETKIFEGKVDIKKGKKTFLTRRTFH